MDSRTRAAGTLLRLEFLPDETWEFAPKPRCTLPALRQARAMLRCLFDAIVEEGLPLYSPSLNILENEGSIEAFWTSEDRDLYMFFTGETENCLWIKSWSEAGEVQLEDGESPPDRLLGLYVWWL